ncbi:hypothetical protein Tco_0033299 [Tanacetum coccineum]
MAPNVEVNFRRLLRLGKSDLSGDIYRVHLGVVCLVLGKRALSLYYWEFTTRHNRGALSWYDLSVACHSKDSGPSYGLYLVSKLITPDLICPSTYQLLRNSGGNSGPDLSFDRRMSARVSLAEASKPDLSFGCSGRDYTSSLMQDDRIVCLNKAMAFLSVIAASRVTVKQAQGRQGQSYADIGYNGNATSSGGNNVGGQAMVVKCYNCQGEGHMASQILDEEQLAFLTDLGILDGQAAQTTIPNNVAFQTEDLDAYDSDCDDVSNAKVVLMANLSNYSSDIILEVPHSESYHNDLDNQSVHAM